MTRKITLHKTDIILDKDKTKEIMEAQGLSYADLHHKMVEKFGLDLKYKGFMSLLSNNSSWKLLYAYALSETLHTDISELFKVVNVDIDKKKKEKEEWKEKYQK